MACTAYNRAAELARHVMVVVPVLNGIAFATRSTGYALNDVVVAQLDLWRPVPALRRFAGGAKRQPGKPWHAPRTTVPRS